MTSSTQDLRHSTMGTEIMQQPARYPRQGNQFLAPNMQESPFVVQGGRVQGPTGDNMMPIPISTTETQRESTHRFVGFGVGVASVFAEHILSHPCIVLKRQCQVNNTSKWFHTTPFTIFQVVFNIQRNQSMTTLWKGINSVFLVKGITLVSESVISEVTPLPREITRHSSLKSIGQHMLLKGLSIIVTTPFYASCLVETVQSEIASEKPGVFDCLLEGFARLFSWSSPQTARLFPIWKLVLPTVFYGLCHYTITSLAKYTVTVSASNEYMERDKGQGELHARSVYEDFYPQLLATFTGNMLADTMLYPLETVLNRLLLQGTRTIIDDTDTGLGVIPINTSYDGLLDCLRSILTEEGLSGFYKGFGALIMQYGIHMAILKLASFGLEKISQEMSASDRRRFNPQAPNVEGGVGPGQHRTQQHSLRQFAAANQANQNQERQRTTSGSSYRHVPMSESYRQAKEAEQRRDPQMRPDF